LVSNAFERIRETPLLGMEKFINAGHKDHKKTVDTEIAKLIKQNYNGWPRLVIAGEAKANELVGPDISRSESHGGFDNDSFTLNSILYRILGKKPTRLFDARDLQY
jgi:hypothetical protein